MRLFYAVPVGGAAAGRLREAVAELRACGCDARWGDAPFHMTMAFLGEVPPARLPAARAAGSRAASGWRACRAELERLGAFPSWSGPRVVWAGVGAGAEALASAAAALRRELEAEGFALEPRPFLAHVTLGRLRGPRGARRLRAAAARWDAARFAGAEFAADALVLHESRLSPEGAVHAALDRFSYN